MPRVEERIVVGRPVAAVFAVATDPAAMPRWQHGVVEARRDGDGPPGVGSRMTGSREYAGVRMGWTTEITAWDPPRRMAFRSVGGPLRAAGEQTFAPAPGGTAVTLALDLAVPRIGLLRLGDRVVERVAEELRRDLAALKQLCEGPKAPSPG
jgi:uncharacterized membrane protein